MGRHHRKPEIVRSSGRVDEEAGAQHQIENGQRQQDRAQDDMHC